MSIPTRLKIKYKDGVIEDNVSFATISYGSDLNDENVWKSWWYQWYSIFKKLQAEGKSPEKDFDMDKVLWFQPKGQNFIINVK